MCVRVFLCILECAFSVSLFTCLFADGTCLSFSVSNLSGYLFTTLLPQVYISSTKSMMGHTLGAAGGLEAIICAQVLKHGEIPPTKNLENPALEDGCDLNYCPGEKASRAPVALCVSSDENYEPRRNLRY